jgi:hypothetical protein
VKDERAFGIGRIAVDLKDVGQHLPQRVDARAVADFGSDLGGQVGQAARAVGLPEPARSHFLEGAQQRQCLLAA